MHEAVEKEAVGAAPTKENLIPVADKPSFRDMVAGKEGPSSLIEELDVILTKEDVRVNLDGPLPRIDFADRVHDSIDAKLACSIIVRLLGKAIGYRALLTRVKALWVPVGKLELVDLDNEYYLVRFKLESDYDRVLSGGPWVIYGSYLTVQPWSRSFSTSEAYPQHIVVWARLPGLSYRYYTKSMFRAIAEMFGNVVRIDYNTLEGKKGRFARFAIVVDLNKPLLSGVVIDGFRQDVEYEGLPLICYKCGKYGYQKEVCGIGGNPEVGSSSNSSPSVEGGASDKEIYGPWMQVQTRRRKPMNVANRGGEGGAANRSGNRSMGSRFNALVIEDDNIAGDVSKESAEDRDMGNVLNKGKSVSEDMVHDGGKDVGVEKVGSSNGKNRGRVDVVMHEDSTGKMQTVGDAVEGESMDVTAGDGKIASAQEVVVEKSSLGGGNHTVIRVFDKGDKDVLRDVNGRVLKGAARKQAVRNVPKNPLAAKNAGAKGLKIKKRDERGPPKPVLKEWINNMTAELDAASNGGREDCGTSSSRTEKVHGPVQWQANTVFEDGMDGDMLV
ncbi:hypothetical protein HRI_002733000 [Hibiscus trionum]|uniref:DUF4283 domain-containing protein n=1 Tax=Hibiscus trionum TaxID=183268 RepID=A0A9W7I8A7_HIBTR|nr:hypothetical protein HRI_002733000 [Hibiscus trionum]